MTDAAAAAIAAPIETPIQQEAAPPTPISNEPPAAGEAKLETPKEMPSTRDALRAAAAKVEAREAAKVDPAKDPAKGADLTRDQTTGKFAPKDAKPTDPAAAKPAPGEKPDVQPAPAAKAEDAASAAKRTVAAPERFSNDAKAVWDTAPEPVKAEVDRMHREMTQGIDKYRKSAERDEKLARFHDQAERGGTTVETALDRYTKMEGLLRQNPMKGLEAVCENIGVSLRQVAEIVLGKAPDQDRADTDTTIRELRQTVQRLEQQVGGVTQGIEKQRTDGLQKQIESWAADRPMFDIYAPHIATEIREGAANLDEAEERVFQKYPQLAELAKASGKKPDADPALKPAASSAAAPDLSAQTEKGSKSITGAPTGGSEPTARKPSGSIKEALKRAASRAG